MQIVWEEKRRSSGVNSAGTMRCAVQEQKAIVDVDGREMQARSAVRPRRPVRGRGGEELGDDTSCEVVCSSSRGRSMLVAQKEGRRAIWVQQCSSCRRSGDRHHLSKYIVLQADGRHTGTVIHAGCKWVAAWLEGQRSWWLRHSVIAGRM